MSRPSYSGPSQGWSPSKVSAASSGHGDDLDPGSRYREPHRAASPSKHCNPSISYKNKAMILSSSRQEFLPGEPNGSTVRYGRQGNLSVSKCGVFLYVLLSLVLAALVGALVFFLAPCKDEEKAVVEDDLSWDIGTLHVRNADDKIRLQTNVIPSYYRLKIKPNFTTWTFDGNVAITLSTHKSSIKHISLHSRDLEILDGYALTEQTIVTTTPALPKKIRRRRDDEAAESTTGNTTTMATTTEVNSLQKPTEAVNTTMSNETLNPTEMPKLDNDTLKVNATVKNTLGHELPGYNIKLTAHDLDLNSTKVNGTMGAPGLTQVKTKRMKIVSKELNPSIDRLIFTLDSHLKPNTNYTLEIKFRGNMDDSLTGFYRSTYRDLTDNTTEVLAVTQFEPTSARKAFPCFDEPNFKAMFEISIARTKEYTALSNMPLISEEIIPGDEGLIWSHFERSLPMSTYLVAYCISGLVPVEAQTNSNDKDDVQLKVWSRKEYTKQTKYAAEIGPKILDFYEKYFGVPYSLPKIDLIAIPDFAVDGMENWGMVTFGETSLLIDPDSESIKSKKDVASVIAHELVHQWFGNLVTMRWWNDLWLNEGFSTYLEYLGVNAIEPSWEMLDQFILDRMGVLYLDSMQSTRPVSTDVVDESEITQIFDDISYMKAASLLRMLNHILTKPIFHAGLVNYMTKWQYGNADQDDLWAAFTLAANKTLALPESISVETFMNSWTLQSGYPVINVTRNYEAGTATVTQNRFLLSNAGKKPSTEMWYVPISYEVGNTSSSAWSTSPRAWLAKEPSTVVLLPENTSNTWVYFNVMGIGHYRVNYDLRNWKLLEYGLYDTPKEFPVVMRAQLLDDAFNLARSGQLNYTVPLDLTKYMIGLEKDLIPWSATLDNLEQLNQGMQRSTKYALFQEYISRLIMPTLKLFGYTVRSNDTSQDTILRETLIYWACLIEEPTCLEWVWGHFNNWTKQANPDKDNPIPFSSRHTIYSNALRLGSKKEFDFLFERFEKSNDPEVRAEILCSLTSTRNTWQLYSLLEYSVNTLDIQLVPLLWNSMSSDLASQIAFRFVSSNWDRVYSKFNPVDDTILQSIAAAAFKRIASEQELRQFKRFIHASKEELKSVSQVVHKSVEAAVLRIQWGKTKMEDVERWLVKFSDSKTNTVNEFSTL